MKKIAHFDNDHLLYKTLKPKTHTQEPNSEYGKVWVGKRTDRNPGKPGTIFLSGGGE